MFTVLLSMKLSHKVTLKPVYIKVHDSWILGPYIRIQDWVAFTAMWKQAHFSWELFEQGETLAGLLSGFRPTNVRTPGHYNHGGFNSPYTIHSTSLKKNTRIFFWYIYDSLYSIMQGSEAVEIIVLVTNFQLIHPFQLYLFTHSQGMTTLSPKSPQGPNRQSGSPQTP